MPFLDCTCVKGETRGFSSIIEVTNDNGVSFEPLDLNEYSVKFQVLGAPVADAEVLLEKIITQNTNLSDTGQIDDPDNGSFTFTVSADDTNLLGLGKFPIRIVLLDAVTLDEVFTLTQGAENGEYNKIYIVQV